MKLALIGANDAATYESIENRIPGVSFTAIVESDRQNAQFAAETLGVSLITNTIGEAIQTSAESFDALIVRSSSDSLSEIASIAAKAGKHLLIENGFDEYSMEMDSTDQAFRSAGITLMIGNTMRYQPSVQTIKRTLGEGKLGEPGLFRMHQWFTENGSADQSLMGPAVAGIDLAVWLFGNAPTSVYSLKSDGYLQIHLGFPADGMAILDFAGKLQGGDDYTSLSFIGSTGAAYADDHHNRNLLFTEGVSKSIETGQGGFAYINQLKEFATAVNEKREPSPSSKEAKTVFEVTEAVQASIDENCAMQKGEKQYEPA